MLSLFLHRISVVHVYLHIAATTLDPAGWDLRQEWDSVRPSLRLWEYPNDCIDWSLGYIWSGPCHLKFWTIQTFYAHSHL